MMTMKMMRMSKAGETTEMMAEDLMSSKWNQMNEMSSEQLLVNSREKAMEIFEESHGSKILATAAGVKPQH